MDGHGEVTKNYRVPGNKGTVSHPWHLHSAVIAPESD